ncbi:hypothetical protein LIER_31981 [Lithospermum erythrorhizon]|uniref:Tetratricopeptide repeat protein 38 n=1 Tax=Lithospermum erythrorhizon TaxID=34254 RepID=A0AAV3RSP5_LITER
MKLDKWGYAVNTSSEACINAINSYYLQVLTYGRQRKVILDAPKHDPHCVLGNILAAHYLSSIDSSHASPLIEAAKACLADASLYEKAVFDTVNYLMSPDRDDDIAVEFHFKLLKDFPKDLVSLKRVQILCFYMGRADLSLNLVQQVLPINEHEKYVYGMLAFPLLELGRFEDAEKAAKKGFEIDNEDPWVQHAICHVYQFQCRFEEAMKFMVDCSNSWKSLSSFMNTHNWWHVALCLLEGSSPIQRVRDIYDKKIWKELEKKDATPAEVYLNAIGLLLRIYVRGEIESFEDQFKVLAKCLTDEIYWFLEWHLDLLILWALSCSGEVAKAEKLLQGLETRLSRLSQKKQDLMKRALTLAKAMYNYGKGDNEQALDLFGHEFDVINCKIIGASDEQLDVFNDIYISLLLNTGRAEQAIQFIQKLLQKREGSPFLWRLLERAYSTLGMNEAANAGAKAKELEGAYFT